MSFWTGSTFLVFAAACLIYLSERRLWAVGMSKSLLSSDLSFLVEVCVTFAPNDMPRSSFVAACTIPCFVLKCAIPIFFAIARIVPNFVLKFTILLLRPAMWDW